MGKLLNENNPLHEVDRLVTRFKIPLEGARSKTEEIQREFEEMMEYAVITKSSSNSQLPTVGYAVICESLQRDKNQLTLPCMPLEVRNFVQSV